MSEADLHLGDCLKVMPTMPDQSVDMVLADLPYGTTRCAWDSPIPLEPLWVEYRRICRGPIVLFAQTPFDKVLGASNLAMLRYEWIWEKTSPTGHLNAKKAPMWFVSALWPLILTAIFGAAFMYGPFWIGRKLRGLFS